MTNCHKCWVYTGQGHTHSYSWEVRLLAVLEITVLAKLPSNWTLGKHPSLCLLLLEASHVFISCFSTRTSLVLTAALAYHFVTQPSSPCTQHMFDFPDGRDDPLQVRLLIQTSEQGSPLPCKVTYPQVPDIRT